MSEDELSVLSTVSHFWREELLRSERSEKEFSEQKSSSNSSPEQTVIEGWKCKRIVMKMKNAKCKSVRNNANDRFQAQIRVHSWDTEV
jgi:hypothetical protein